MPLDQPEDHPIFGQEHDYILGTSTSHELYKIVKSMIRLRHIGNAVIGKSRIGKSKAIDFVIKRLEDEYCGEIFILKHACSSYPTSHPYFEAFFSDILRSFEHIYDFQCESACNNDPPTAIIGVQN